MAGIISLQPSNKGFRPFGGPGLAENDTIWRTQNAHTSFTELVADANFGNAMAGSTQDMANAGAGLRGAFSLVSKTGPYNIAGLFDAAATAFPNIYTDWYGFYGNNGYVTLRKGSVSDTTQYPYSLAATRWAVKLYDDSVRYYLDDVEIDRTAAPAPAAKYYGGVILSAIGDTVRDAKESAQTFTTH